MSGDEWSDDEWSEDVESNSSEVQLQAPPYSILTLPDIKQQQAESILKLSDECGLNETLSTVFLIQNNWNSDLVIQKVLSSIIQIPAVPTLTPSPYCPVCFSDLSDGNCILLDCSHSFCTLCLQSYLVESVEQGPGSLLTRCPIPDCQFYIQSSVFSNYLPKSDYEKFLNFLVNSFINNRNDAKWCPSAGCQNAIIYKQQVKEVSCLCGFVWCFNCSKETHRPLSCELLVKWTSRINLDDSENWILANTKNCPKCKNGIEKNLGCMHMTCKCGHEFCWLCLGNWKEHGAITGGYYSCNKFRENRDQGKYSSEESKRINAGLDARRFEHYFSRFNNHKDSLKRALYQKELCDKRVAKMNEKFGEVGLFSFYQEAADLVYSSKRNLAYSYPVGYFLGSAKKIRFYEFIQGELESNVIRLEELLEKDLNDYSEDIEGSWGLNKNYHEYRIEVLSCLDIVKKYFSECFVQIESGFPEVIDDGVDDRLNEFNEFEVMNYWICTACTFRNNTSADVCSACNSRRLLRW